MDKVYVVAILDRDRDKSWITHISTHTTKDRATRYLAAYCRGQWEEQGQDYPLNTDDTKTIEKYFEFWGEEMTYDILEEVIDPDPVEVDHSKEFSALPVDEDSML